ncbi:macrolide family glycosyltransferase [Micromonospora sp. NPDC049903]|uniref:macrolide family glycosyltransferase n=1 Tax=Micromonospora sp. NPDC049903 TaxID=3364276 RepID=UPI0037B188FF
MVNMPARGHVFPTLALVAGLVERGHRVVYTAVGEYADLVRSAGAEVLSYDSVDPMSVIGGADSGRVPLLLLDECEAIIRAAREHFADAPPDLVAYDGALLQAGRILARVWGRPATQLSPVFASNEHYSFPEQMMKAAGPASMDNGVMAEFFPRMAGMLAAHGVELDPMELVTAVEGQNLVFLAREFQPAGATFDDRFAFVGPCLGERGFLGDWRPPSDGRPVVLVTLGTVHNGDTEFFRSCLAAFADGPWHVVISVGEGVDPADLGAPPKNVEIHRWVPHLKVLEHADAFVTHGGMGSVNEALYWGCPMVVVPPWPDVVPNAWRLVELGIARQLDPTEISADLLRESVAAVTDDPEMRERARQMRTHTREAGGAPRAVEELEAYLQRAA